MSARLRAFAALGAGLLLAGAPRLAEACSVCMSGREDENRLAFIGTTVFLSVLPLAMVGGLGWYLHRRSRAAAEAQPRARRADLDALPTPR